MTQCGNLLDAFTISRVVMISTVLVVDDCPMSFQQSQPVHHNCITLNAAEEATCLNNSPELLVPADPFSIVSKTFALVISRCTEDGSAS